jgi:cellulose synthase operon protein C
MSAPDAPPECPSLETLAAFADGALPAAERAAVVAHVARCPRCRELVSSAVIAKREEPARRVPGFRRWWLMGGGLAAAAAVLLGVGGLWRRPPPESGLRELVQAEAARDTRRLEARLTGGFAHGAAPRVMRGPSPPPPPPEVQIAIARIDQAAAEHPSAATQHAQALARLVEGKGDQALSLLAALVRERPTAAAWSDLAAAQLARGGVLDAAAALSSTEAALKHDPRLPEALFNRALALERMNRGQEARAAWDQYLAADGGSPWAAEARERRQRIEDEAPRNP